jgi:hypothetical protein
MMFRPIVFESARINNAVELFADRQVYDSNDLGGADRRTLECHVSLLVNLPQPERNFLRKTLPHPHLEREGFRIDEATRRVSSRRISYRPQASPGLSIAAESVVRKRGRNGHRLYAPEVLGQEEVLPEPIGAHSGVAGDHVLLQVCSGEGCVVLDKKECVFIVLVDLQERPNDTPADKSNARPALQNRSPIDRNVHQCSVG